MGFSYLNLDIQVDSKQKTMGVLLVTLQRGVQSE